MEPTRKDKVNTLMLICQMKCNFKTKANTPCVLNVVSNLPQTMHRAYLESLSDQELETIWTQHSECVQHVTGKFYKNPPLDKPK